MTSSKAVFQELYKSLSNHLTLPEAQAQSFLILDHIFGLKRTDIVGDKVINYNSSEIHTVLQPIKERIKTHEPIQYILGETEFYGLKLKVTRDVLIPRPETEELVDLIIKENLAKKEVDILDICTGSGCIAIALNKNIQSKCYALDISPEALSVAQENNNHIDTKVVFKQWDILNASFPFEYKFDVIVSNPPYVTYSEKKLMHSNVLHYEPELALFVPDADPLKFYKRIAELGIDLLKEGGRLYFEINERFGNEVKSICDNLDYKDTAIIKDLSQKDRIIRAVF